MQYECEILTTKQFVKTYFYLKRILQSLALFII